MSLRAAILVGLAILGTALLGVWIYAPATFAEARGLLNREALAANAALGGPHRSDQDRRPMAALGRLR